MKYNLHFYLIKAVARIKNIKANIKYKNKYVKNKSKYVKIQKTGKSKKKL